jgi:thiol-disulfide isomerase/thioredoxin
LDFGLKSRASVPVLFLIAALLAGAGSGSGITGEVDAKGLAQRIAREQGRVVLVNFWATWCVPCREEFPDLSRLQQNYGARGLQVLGVSTDLASQMPAVQKFLTEQSPRFPNYRKKSGGDDQQFIDAVERSWGGELPFSVLFARDGRKAKVLSGKHTYREYEQEVLKLLE